MTGLGLFHPGHLSWVRQTTTNSLYVSSLVVLVTYTDHTLQMWLRPSINHGVPVIIGVLHHTRSPTKHILPPTWVLTYLGTSLEESIQSTKPHHSMWWWSCVPAHHEKCPCQVWGHYSSTVYIAEAAIWRHLSFLIISITYFVVAAHHEWYVNVSCQTRMGRLWWG